MVKTQLEIILEELGRTTLIAMSSLRPNDKNTCLIPLPDGMKIQVEMDKYEKNLIIGCVLGDIEPGHYRNSLFQAALIANGLPHPRYGVLAYGNKTNKLVLHDTLSMHELNGEKVAEYLGFFLEKARTWKQAIEGGNVPHISAAYGSQGTVSVFGLKL
ncbi:MAG: CesT family type III secretion system chaperone [Parachlamydiaceae bacterium]|nr:CesT family type III secretion system chaperone [Parachlamydiaceae bacterium]